MGSAEAAEFHTPQDVIKSALVPLILHFSPSVSEKMILLPTIWLLFCGIPNIRYTQISNHVVDQLYHWYPMILPSFTSHQNIPWKYAYGKILLQVIAGIAGWYVIAGIAGCLFPQSYGNKSCWPIPISMDWFIRENLLRKAPWSSWENLWFPVSIFPSINPLTISLKCLVSRHWGPVQHLAAPSGTHRRLAAMPWQPSAAGARSNVVEMWVITHYKMWVMICYDA